MTEAIEISLKGEGALWRGMTDSSEQAPTDGYFRTLENCYISRDGSEIRSFPGSALVAKPGWYGHPFAITGFDQTQEDSTRIFFKPLTPFDSYLPSAATIAGNPALPLGTVYISGVGGSVTDGEYTATRAGATGIDIAVDTRGETLNANFAFIRPRVGMFPSRCGYVSDYPMVIGESLNWIDDGVTPRWSVAGWVSDGNLDWDAVSEAWEYWASPVNDTKVVQLPSGKTNFVSQWPARLRPGLVEANGRAIIPVPGWGTVAEMNLWAKRTSLTDEGLGRWVKCLGVPKATIVRVESEAGRIAAGRDRVSSGAITYLRVAYRDRATGEMGLSSQGYRAVASTYIGSSVSGDNAAWFKLTVTHPREILRECADYNIVVFSTGEGGDADTGYYPIAEKMLFNSDTRDVEIEIFNVQEEATWISFPQVPDLEQMPMGASVATFVRGHTFFAGGIAQGVFNQGAAPEVGPGRTPFYDSDHHKERITVALVDGRKPDPTEEERAIQVLEKTIDSEPHLTGSNCAAWRVSPAYLGQELQVPIEGDLFPGEGGNRSRVSLEDMPLKHTFRYAGKFIDDPLPSEKFTADLMLPRGQLWHSEADHPGVVPATNRIFTDPNKGTDVRALGRLGDNVVACTERETYVIGFGRSPVGATPYRAPDPYGCVAPHSMVEFPGGLAWLAADGPVVLRGARVEWVGRSIRDRWAGTYKVDARGLMWNAWGTYDQERDLVIWGLTSGWDDTDFADALEEGDKARVPADELLMMNVTTGGLSFHRPPSGRKIYDACQARSADGRMRTTFLADNDWLYQIEGGFLDESQSTVSATIPSAGSGVLAFTFTGALTGAVENSRAMITNPDGSLAWEGQFLSASGSAAVIGSAASFSAGATFEVNTHRMVVETVATKHSELRYDQRVNAVSIHYSLAKDSGTARAFADVDVMDEAGNAKSLLVSSSEGNIGRVMAGKHVVRLSTGYNHSLGDSRIRVTVFSNCEVRLKDIRLEVARGG